MKTYQIPMSKVLALLKYTNLDKETIMKIINNSCSTGIGMCLLMQGRRLLPMMRWKRYSEELHSNKIKSNLPRSISMPILKLKCLFSMMMTMIPRRKKTINPQLKIYQKSKPNPKGHQPIPLKPITQSINPRNHPNLNSKLQSTLSKHLTIIGKPLKPKIT